ncbi:MAG: hypothetical protein QOE97_3933 [Pseudonocardiales bacterium]|nr:hypothetical protein [Pseudonocardiales bacterium]
MTAVARRVDPGYDLVDGEEALLRLATDAVCTIAFGGLRVVDEP